MKRTLLLASFFAVLPRSAAAEADREIIKVNGAAIRQSEVLERLWQRYGTETLDEMVDELLLRQAARGEKLKADPKEVERRLSRLRSQFSDPKIFDAQVQQYGSSMEKLKGDLADQVVRDRLVVSQKRLSVSDAEIRKAFEEHKDELGVQAGVHLRHILVKNESEAKDIEKQVKAGGDFQKLAREKSMAPTGKVNGGDYGVVTKGMLPPDIETIAFAMKPGELRLVPSEKGVHVLQALERRAPVPAQYEAVKDELKGLLLEQKVKEALPDYLRELRQKADIKPQGE